MELFPILIVSEEYSAIIFYYKHTFESLFNAYFKNIV